MVKEIELEREILHSKTQAFLTIGSSIKAFAGFYSAFTDATAFLFQLNETCFQLKETCFQLKETCFELKQKCFQLMETCFQLKVTCFQLEQNCF